MPVRHHRLRPRGVTLIEILVVLAIVALVSAGIAIAAIRYLDHAKKETTRQSALTLRMVITTYRMQHADECPSIEQLVEAEAIDSVSKTKDAWEQAFKIECDDKGRITVASSGPDKKLGTEDDIRVPEPARAN
jgi:general secretion pathway protein G